MKRQENYNKILYPCNRRNQRTSCLLFSLNRIKVLWKMEAIYRGKNLGKEKYLLYSGLIQWWERANHWKAYRPKIQLRIILKYLWARNNQDCTQIVLSIRASSPKHKESYKRLLQIEKKQCHLGRSLSRMRYLWVKVRSTRSNLTHKTLLKP